MYFEDTGKYITDKGYIRYYKGPFKKKYEHRVIIEQLLQKPIGLCFINCTSIPNGFHVHHIDEDKTHNCTGNLILLDACIHNKIHYDRANWIKNNYQAWYAWISSKLSEQ